MVKIKDADDFSVYRRLFFMVATYLKNKSRLTEREISNIFFKGCNYLSEIKYRHS